MNAPGMSTVATSLPSSASMTHNSMTDLIATIGALASSFAVDSLCFLPSAHPWPFMVPVLFF
jgi:hypothetical protein